VRELSQYLEIEILGLDSIATETEVLEAIKTALLLEAEDNSTTVRSLRLGFGA